MNTKVHVALEKKILLPRQLLMENFIWNLGKCGKDFLIMYGPLPALII
jgi:hypothetical protein